jgi:hypothetical protein
MNSIGGICLLSHAGGLFLDPSGSGQVPSHRRLATVKRYNRSTARNDETLSALDFLKQHRATFQQAAAKK